MIVQPPQRLSIICDLSCTYASFYYILHFPYSLFLSYILKFSSFPYTLIITSCSYFLISIQLCLSFISKPNDFIIWLFSAKICGMKSQHSCGLVCQLYVATEFISEKSHVQLNGKQRSFILTGVLKQCCLVLFNICVYCSPDKPSMTGNGNSNYSLVNFPSPSSNL